MPLIMFGGTGGGSPDRSHENALISSEFGTHGIRWIAGRLQVCDNGRWINTGLTSGSNEIPLSEIYGIGVVAAFETVHIKWGDPDDTFAEGNISTRWAGTKLVRKTSGYPTDETDGVTVLDNNIRNAYKTTFYSDSGLSNGAVYYYGLFPYSDTGVVYDNPSNRVMAEPNPVRLGSVSRLTAKAGNGCVTVKWYDPDDVVTDTVTTAKWAGTKLVRKIDSYPENETDGVVIADCKKRNMYSVDGFADGTAENGMNYYYKLFPYTDNGVYTIDAANEAPVMKPSAARVFGARWYKNEPSTQLTRLYDADGKVFSPSVGSKPGLSDFDSEPIYRDIRLCNVDVGGNVFAYLGDDGFSRMPATGDVMVEIPRFYYKVEETEDYRDYLISDGQMDGFMVSPRHAGHPGKPDGYDKIYISAYTVNPAYRSASGDIPAYNITRSKAREGCRNRGAGYAMYDYATYITITLLYIIETADWDSQSAVGCGFTDGNTLRTENGGADSVASHTGRADGKANEGRNSVKYRHMENLWGNIMQHVDGINFHGADIYICTDPSDYMDDTQFNYSKLSYVKAQEDGYISVLGYDSDCPFAQIPVGSGGSESEYIGDYYNCSTDWRILAVGGYWSGGRKNGLFYCSTNLDSSYSSIALGARIIMLP